MHRVQPSLQLQASCQIAAVEHLWVVQLGPRRGISSMSGTLAVRRQSEVIGEIILRHDAHSSEPRPLEQRRMLFSCCSALVHFVSKHAQKMCVVERLASTGERVKGKSVQEESKKTSNTGLCLMAPNSTLLQHRFGLWL